MSEGDKFHWEKEASPAKTGMKKDFMLFHNLGSLMNCVLFLSVSALLFTFIRFRVDLG